MSSADQEQDGVFDGAEPIDIVERGAEDPAEEVVKPKEGAGEEKVDADVYQPEAYNLNVKQEYKHTKPLKDILDLEDPETYLSLINGSVKDLLALVENHPNLNPQGDAEARAWTQLLDNGREAYLQGNALESVAHRDGADLRQYVEYEGDRMAISKPRFSDTGSVLSGERAVLRMAALTGLGSIIQVPLWHTGIWLSFKAPHEDELLELERLIANEEVMLGRVTNGMIYSNTSVIFTMNLVDFALNHVFDTNAQVLSVDYLKSIIKITDIPLILWGLALSIYPNGHPYAAACTNPEGKCTHVFKELLDLGKLVWTDWSSLSEWQRARMTKRRHKVSDADLERYASEHVRGGRRVIKLNEQVSLALRVPVLVDYETSGYSWVNGIVTSMDGAFKTKLQGKERNNYVLKQARVTTLRQYSHWVDEVLSPGLEFSKDRETVEGMMSNLSSLVEERKTFIEEVGKYIDDATLSYVAIPKHKCPVCGCPQTVRADEEGNLVDVGQHPSLIPIDVPNTFFTLARHRIYKALTNPYL